MPAHPFNPTPGQRSTVLVTGSAGFIGSAVLNTLVAARHTTIGAVRSAPDRPFCVLGPALEPDSDWSQLLCGIQVVVHAAARVHLMQDRTSDPLLAFRAINVLGTLNLARQAAATGVRRFVFLSSAKVNGEQTPSGHAFTSADTPSPQDAYGISKAEAEAGLKAIGAEAGMEIVIIRPPLVYGPGVKANFAAMMQAVRRGLPLPFGGVTNNRRSLVALDNLVDLIVTCIDHPAAANQTFMVSDGEDLSSADLLRRLGAAMGRPARLLNIPPVVLAAAATLLGKKEVARRLLGNLQVDITHTCDTLNWRPPVSVDEGLRRAVRGMRQ